MKDLCILSAKKQKYIKFVLKNNFNNLICGTIIVMTTHPGYHYNYYFPVLQPINIIYLSLLSFLYLYSSNHFDFTWLKTYISTVHLLESLNHEGFIFFEHHES